MNRKTALTLSIAGLILVAACTPAPEEAAPAAAPEATAAAPAEAPAAEQPKPGLPGPDAEGMLPMTLPEPVIDTTPVDTVVSRIDSSNAANADSTELAGPISDQFGAKDSVYLDIRTNGTAEKYTISSKWFYPDGQVITENSQIVNSAGPTSTLFSMSKPDGWAPGTYKVEISINGKLQQTKTFEVR